MEEIQVTDEQRRAALRHLLLGGGRARVYLTSGQRRALEEVAARQQQALRVLAAAQGCLGPSASDDDLP